MCSWATRLILPKEEGFTECVAFRCRSSTAKQVPYCLFCILCDYVFVCVYIPVSSLYVLAKRNTCGPCLGCCSLSPLMRMLFSQATGLRC